jgi:hypothetical protein
MIRNVVQRLRKSWLSSFRGPSALAVVEESSPAYKKPQCSSL